MGSRSTSIEVCRRPCPSRWGSSFGPAWRKRRSASACERPGSVSGSVASCISSEASDGDQIWLDALPQDGIGGDNQRAGRDEQRRPLGAEFDAERRIEGASRDRNGQDIRKAMVGRILRVGLQGRFSWATHRLRQ